MKPLWCIAVTLAIPLGAVAAQETQVVPAGTRVRVTTPDAKVVGTLESLDGNTIVVRPADGTSVALPLAGSAVDVSDGLGMCGASRRGVCIVVGTLAGGAVGLGVGKFAESQCDFCGGQVYPYTMLGGAVLGGIVGALVGGEHWRRVELPAQVSFDPRTRLRVAISLRF